jgi:hypothetical protein
MSKEHPLYPELAEAGKEEAQKACDNFKEQLLKIAEEAMGSFYCDVAVYIESDSWTNYRNELLDGISNYGNRKTQGAHDFAKVRKAIYREFRDDIIEDLDQDNLKEIENLKAEIEGMRGLQRLAY